MNKMYYILENISERDETFLYGFYYEAKSFTEEEKQKKNILKYVQELLDSKIVAKEFQLTE